MDYVKLNEVVDGSGLVKTRIAAEMGISPQSFQDKMRGRRNWTLKDVIGFSRALHLTNKQRDDIFLR